MKRALPGKKRKQAIPARKPAAKKRSPVRKSKTSAARTKVTRPKDIQTSVAKKVTRPKRARITKRPVAKRVVARKKSIARIAPVAAPELIVAAPTPGARPKASRTTVRKSQFTLPAFLLEGDEPNQPALSGPGEKFALGPTPPLDHFDEAKAPLPESYGTGRLFLTARDPHWLYAHWDFTMQEQFRYNARSLDRHMVLRLHEASQPGSHISEIHVHPESRHWFAHVDNAGEKYFAEIGYYQAGRKWKSLATSEPQRTPPDNISADSSIEFATIPLELSFETMLALLKEHPGDDAGQNLPLARAIENIRRLTREDFPEAMQIAEWTPGQEEALATILAAGRASEALPSSQDSAREESMPPDELQFAEAPSSYVSSFFGGEAGNDFWFNVNAELIVYGATEPNAAVTFSGKQIPLRPDGSFRFHFALPDGSYALPIVAVSADGTDGRAAELKFIRDTEVRGHVTAAPTDPVLKSPPSSDV